MRKNLPGLLTAEAGVVEKLSKGKFSKSKCGFKKCVRVTDSEVSPTVLFIALRVDLANKDVMKATPSLL